MNKKSTFKKTLVAFMLTGLSFFSFGQVLYEGFEGVDFPPAGWSTIDGDGVADDNWSLLASDAGFNPAITAFAGNQYAGSYSWLDVAFTPNNWLITPQLQITDANTSLSFKGISNWGEPNGATGDYLSVLVSTTGTNVGDFTEIFGQNFSTETWENVSLALSAYVGQSIYIAFRHHNCTDQFVMGIDEVLVSAPFEDLQVQNLAPLNNYTFFPKSQTPNTLTLSADVVNNGNSISGNFEVVTSVFKDPDYDNALQTFTSTGTPLAVGATFSVSHSFAVSDTGAYVAVHQVNSATDNLTDNNVAFNFTTISETEYARYDIEGELSNLGIGLGTQGVIGSTIDVTSETIVDSVLFFTQNDTIGGTMQVKIYPFDGVTPSLNAIGQSELIPVTQAIVDQVANDGFAAFAMPITAIGGGALTLTPGKYLVGIEESADAQSIGLYHSDAIFTEGEFFVSLDGAAFEGIEQYNIFLAPLISTYIAPSATTPVITSSDADNSICNGQFLTLTSSIATGNQWNLNGSPIAGATDATLVVGTSGNYTVTNSTVTSTEVIVTVNDLPTINAGSDVNVCDGNTTVLNATGGVSYVWSNGVANGSTITPSSTATLTVTGTDANGCSNADDVVITVVSAPVITLTGTTSPSTCGATDASITVDLGSNMGNLLYSGTSNGNLADVTGSQTISNLATGSYTFVLVSMDGCLSSPITASISDLGVTVPTITTSGATTFCQGGSVTLTSSATSGNTWSTTSTDASITVTSTGSYSVTTVDVNGCVATSDAIFVTVNNNPTISELMNSNPTACAGTDGSITIQSSGNGTLTYNGNTMDVTSSITMIPNLTAGTYVISMNSTAGCPSNEITVQLSDPNVVVPTITVVGDLEFCEGGFVTLTSSDADSYMWSPGGETSQNLTITEPGTYSVTTMTAGCGANSEELVVVVNALPVVSAGDDQNVCLGNPVTLTGSGAETYTWTGGVSNGVAFTPNTSQTYTVTGTDANGCTSTDDVFVGAILDMINAGGDVAICLGESTTLTATNGTNHTWNQGLGAGISHEVTPTQTTTYTLSGTGIAGCPATDDVTVVVNQLPTINAGADQTVCIGADVTLVATGGLTYTWSNGVLNNTPFEATETTTYTVTGADVNGCSGSDEVVVTVDSCASINENSIVGLKVYPNPSNGVITISADDFKSFTSVTVMDQVGRNVINTIEISSNVVTVDLTSVSNGTYLIKLSGLTTKIVPVQINK